MGLFTSLVFNNGTAHTFVFRGQIPDAKSIVGEYIEPAATAESASKVIVKHDVTSKTLKRSLLQRKVMVAGSDGVLYPITVNTTVTYNPKHSASSVTDQTKLQGACIGDATFHTNFALGLI